MSKHPYDLLTPDHVLDAVESLGLLSDSRIIPLNSYENRVYQIGIEEADPVIAKFYRPGRWTPEQLSEEHSFVSELKDAELPVIAPMQIAGRSLHQHGDFTFTLYPRMGGYPPELDQPDTLYRLGQFLGRIHAIGAARNFEHRPMLSLSDFGTASRKTILESGYLSGEMLTAYDTLSRDLLAKLSTLDDLYREQTHIRLHGDAHVGNILWRDDSPFFVDFDDCRSGPAIQDLWLFLSGDRANQLSQLAELTDGYNEFFDFHPVQLRLIEYLRTLRLMHYAAWLTRRWSDPAFPMHFPWFNTDKYWAEHILELREQLAALDEEPLSLYP